MKPTPLSEAASTITTLRWLSHAAQVAVYGIFMVIAFVFGYINAAMLHLPTPWWVFVPFGAIALITAECAGVFFSVAISHLLLLREQTVQRTTDEQNHHN